MKIPRDITGAELVRLLKKLDYHVVRQTGSHIRIRTELKGPTSGNDSESYSNKDWNT